ncbi:hypothetical protein RCH21_001143 [Arthrobacter sp. PL16]|nr:hypothetical protein [Arthrobacter sp. PL16]
MPLRNPFNCGSFVGHDAYTDRVGAGAVTSHYLREVVGRQKEEVIEAG